MTEITLHVGGNANEPTVIHADWSEHNGPHHDTRITLKVINDELTITVNNKHIGSVFPNNLVVTP